jgi:hypothetical protein
MKKLFRCDSEINVKMLPCEQSVSSHEEQNASDNSSKQYVTWVNSGVEQPHFAFTGKFWL